MSKLRSRLTYANVASSLALFLAVSGGTAIAAATIGTSDIQRGAITTSRIDSQAVTSGKIRNNTIRSRDIRNGSLQASDFAQGELPQGPQGPAGPQGPQGPAGPPGASALSGVVSTGGSLIYGRGVTAVAVNGPGVYTVSFNQNVSQCPAVATIGGFQLGGNTQSGSNGGTVSLQPGGNDNPVAAQQITFVTRDLTGANAALPFHFAVFC
ncbi:MAG TPA: hypothetical protein VFR97_11845 [Capillimicrobium sp.]|nr:hypothetical protein [Capillimicrobium sp.]